MRIFICKELINNLDANIGKIKEIQPKVDKYNYEAYFIFAFALFESALCEAMRHMLSAFPEKINSEKQFTLSSDVLYKNMFSPQMILSSLIDSEIKKISKGSAHAVIAEAERICAIQALHERNRLEEISHFRNLLTHANTPSKGEYLLGLQSESKNHFTLELAKRDIAYLIDVLESFALEIANKYRKYTVVRLLQDLWNTLFNSPLLRFEDCVLIRAGATGNTEKKIVGFHFDYIEKISNSISSGEKFLLSMVLQQYSVSLNDQYYKFRDIPMLVTMGDKRNLYMFLHVMTVYPYLFNGMDMKDNFQEDESNEQT